LAGTSYGENLVKQGLSAGIGKLMSLQVAFKTGSHSGYPTDDSLHSWVACGANVSSTGDDQFYWYQVASCACGNRKEQSALEECAKGVPAAAVAPVRACMADTARAQALTSAMHKYADSFKDYPWVIVDGDDKAVPEPDTHGDKVEPLLAKVCERAQQAHAWPASDLPAACA
jgi:hypothetical protein